VYRAQSIEGIEHAIHNINSCTSSGNEVLRLVQSLDLCSESLTGMLSMLTGIDLWLTVLTRLTVFHR
jgi:hypothetical protein